MDWEALNKEHEKRIEKLQSQINKQFNIAIIISGAFGIIFWIITYLLIKK